MSTPRPIVPASPPPSRRGYRAVVVALAAFLAMVTLLREPFRGYLAEVTIVGHAGDEVDLPAARRWLAASSDGISVHMVTSPIYPGDCELRLQRMGQPSAAARYELDEVASRFLEHYLPHSQAIRRQANLNRLQGELQAARDLEDGLRARLNQLQGRQLAALSQRQPTETTGPSSTATGPQPHAARLDLKQRLAELRLELSRLASRFTDEHPQVITLRSQIAGLEEELGVSEVSDGQPAGNGLDLFPSARAAPGRQQPDSPQFVSTSSLLPIASETDLAAEIEVASVDLSAATRNRQWAERQLETALQRGAERDELLTWSASPATITARIGGTPRVVTLLAALLVALLAGGLMFHAAGRAQSRVLIDSAEQLATLLPLPLVGQTPGDRRPSLAHFWRRANLWAVPAATFAAEISIVVLAVVCLIAALADPSLVPQLARDPFGGWSEIVGRIVG